MEDITVSLVLQEAAPMPPVLATCFHCTSLLNKANNVEKYVRDEKGRLVKDLVPRHRSIELHKVVNPAYVNKVVEFKVVKNVVVDGKHQLGGPCVECNCDVSRYVAKEAVVGEKASAVCWHCTSVLNNGLNIKKYLREEGGKLKREKVYKRTKDGKPSKRPIRKKRLNKNYTSHVLRRMIVENRKDLNGKGQAEGKCCECGTPVSAFVSLGKSQ